ncbi:hypothetical protein [Novosphingobium guangzhouense]|uniref:DNA primase/nucleoside triphosphatase C-terminal domain-containing protein n=1 Tax=Novosphingobium guangzhouense TaxID=1850347 RepID=A0A2K2FUN5_9SPHN|nr:hypothetical protein [Novosphingobium guangzhouense]PNU02499.1 hypothetical protein A8V01_08945 [Novosphingobium guangzhouense]
MSAVRSIDSAAGGATAFQVSQLATLADSVKIAQSTYQSALADLHRAQDRVREAAETLAAAQTRFQDACPVAFGLAPANIGGNPVDDWLSARCTATDRLAKSRASNLYRDFIEWCAASGHAEPHTGRWHQTRFGRELTERGFFSRKDSEGFTVRVGLRLAERERGNG